MTKACLEPTYPYVGDGFDEPLAEINQEEAVPERLLAADSLSAMQPATLMLNANIGA